MSFYDYYKILGLPHSASAEEIRAAYREQAIRFHPDKNPGNPQAEEVFKVISGAYEVLSDPEKKTRYDLGFAIVVAEMQRQAPENRKKYGISKRIFKTREQELAEQIAYYEYRVKNFSFLNRSLLHGGLAVTGWLIMYSNWFIDLQGYEFGYIFLGAMIFLIATGAFCNDLFLQFNYQYNRHLIHFNYERRVLWLLLLSLGLGTFMLFQATAWQFSYHMKHYGVLGFGQVENISGQTMRYRFETHEGTVYRWATISRQELKGIGEGDLIQVKYSSENPRIAMPLPQ